MKLNLSVEPYSAELSKRLYDAFAEQTLERMGVNGNNPKLESLVLSDDDQEIGVIVLHRFWGSIMIPYLYVEKPYRGKGLGRQLISHAVDYAQKHDCHFLSTETSSFEALDFYKKLGFELEFTRGGYSHEVKVHYLRLPIRKV